MERTHTRNSKPLVPAKFCPRIPESPYLFEPLCSEGIQRVSPLLLLSSFLFFPSFSSKKEKEQGKKQRRTVVCCLEAPTWWREYPNKRKSIVNQLSQPT